MRGLSFSEPMVRAWMEGRKSVTRRLMNPQPTHELQPDSTPEWGHREWMWKGKLLDPMFAPYRPGEMVYIKETWRETWSSGSDTNGYEVGIEYRAKIGDGYGKTAKVPEMHYGYNITKKGKAAWRSPRFMPEWAARSRARIVSVRPERMQEISEPDVMFEAPPDYWTHKDGPLGAFIALWDALHPGSWDRNPWVWRIELRKEAGNE